MGEGQGDPGGIPLCVLYLREGEIAMKQRISASGGKARDGAEDAPKGGFPFVLLCCFLILLVFLPLLLSL